MPHSGLHRLTLDYYLRRLRVAITSTMKAASAWHEDRIDGSAPDPIARRTGSVRLLWSVPIPSRDVLLQDPFDFGDGRRICY